MVNIFRRHRCPHNEPEHLALEGDFMVPEKPQYQTVERQKPFLPSNNLVVNDGQFYSETTSKTDYQREIEEERSIRRNTFTKEEVENLNIDSSETTTIRRRTWTKEDFDAVKYKQPERPQQVKPVDNLRLEGEFQSPEKPKFQVRIL